MSEEVDFVKALKHNKWAISYVSIIATVALIINIIDYVKG